MIDKDWYKSVTVWGGIFMIFSIILSQFGFTITSEEQTQLAQAMSNIGTAVAGVVGLVMVIIGRRNAGKEIKTLRISVAKATSISKESSPQSFIDLSNKILGEGPTAILSTAFFLTTKEWKDMFNAVKVAIQSEKGKILLEQLKKVGEDVSQS